MEKEGHIYCPVCSRRINIGVDICPHCRTVIEDVPADRVAVEDYPRPDTFEYGKTRASLRIAAGIIILILLAAIIYFTVNYF